MKLEILNDPKSVPSGDTKNEYVCNEENECGIVEEASMCITSEEKLKYMKKVPDTYIGFFVGNGKIQCRHISLCTDEEIIAAYPHAIRVR